MENKDSFKVDCLFLPDSDCFYQCSVSLCISATQKPMRFLNGVKCGTISNNCHYSFCLDIHVRKMTLMLPSLWIIFLKVIHELPVVNAFASVWVCDQRPNQWLLFLFVHARWLLGKGLLVTMAPPFLPTGRSGGCTGGAPAAQECGGVDGAQTELTACWGHISGQKINTTQPQSCQGAFNRVQPLCCCSSEDYVPVWRLYSHKALKAITHRKG